MDSFIVVIHVLLALLFTLYLVVRLIRSFWGIRDKQKERAIKKSFLYPDWIFITLIIVTGLYPIVVLGHIELYHLIKFILLAIVIYLSRAEFSFNYALTNTLCILIIGCVIVLSFNRNLTFNLGEKSFTKQQTEAPEKLTELEKGKIIYDEFCTPCHGANGRLGTFQAADLTQSNLTFEERVAIISNGSPLTVMRPFKHELTPEEIKAVTRFVEELKSRASK